VGNGTREFIDGLARTPLSQILELVAILTVLRVVIYFLFKDVPPHKRSSGYALGHIASEFADAIIYAGVFVFMVIRPFCVQAFLIPSGSMVQTLQVNDFIVANKAIYRYTDPKVGDIVVFRPPKAAVMPNQLDSQGEVNVDFIKRLAGGPGDTVEIKDNVLFRNGKPVDEPYKAFTNAARSPGSEEPDIFTNMTPDEINSHFKQGFKLVNYKGKPWVVDFEDGHIKYDDQMRDFAPKNDEMAKELTDAPPMKIPDGYYLFIGDNRFWSFDGRYWGLVPREQIIGRAEFIWLPFSHIGRTLSNPGRELAKAP
jgi:signal peptidase I